MRAAARDQIMPAIDRFKNTFIPLTLFAFLIVSGLSLCSAYVYGDLPGLFLAALWTAGLLFAVVVHAIVRRWNRRFERGRCPRCDYDLRATPDRCPECGHELTDSEIPLPPWLAGNALDVHRNRRL